jgi:hypothetical protein
MSEGHRYPLVNYKLWNPDPDFFNTLLGFQKPGSHIIWNTVAGFHKGHHSMWYPEIQIENLLETLSGSHIFSHTHPTLVTTYLF